MIHGVECDPAKLAGARQKYVRVGHIPPTEDQKNYDLGRTSLAVVNAPSVYAGQQIGELWVSYTVMLRKPKIGSGNAYNVRRDLFLAVPRTLTGNDMIADQATLLAGARNSLGCQIIIPAVNTVVPVAGSDDLRQVIPTTLVPVGGITFREQFKLVIPSNYSGVLRLRAIVAGANVTTPSWVPVSYAPATISRFFDIPYMSNTGVREWQHILSTVNDTENLTPPASQSDCELHIRVQPPTNGLPNEIIFGTYGPPTANFIYSWQLEISQLNTFLNVQDTGKNDRWDLVQAFSGQPAIYT
jgi:hypothetical protein